MPRIATSWRRRDPARSDPRLVSDAEAFEAITREAAMRLGCIVEGYADDVATLWSPRLSGRVSLTNVRQQCVPLPRAQWRDVVIEHLDGLAQALERGIDYDDESAVLPLLRARLYPSVLMPSAEVVSRPLGADLVEVLVADREGGIGTVPPAALDAWGRGADDLLDLGRRQVQGAGLVERRSVDLGGVHCTVLEDPSYYTTSHVWWLPTYVDVPDNGALVVLPSRHLVMAHPIYDSTALDAAQALLVNARRLHAEGPGSLSPRLWWWRSGALCELPARVSDERISFMPPADFVDVLSSLPAGS